MEATETVRTSSKPVAKTKSHIRTSTALPPGTLVWFSDREISAMTGLSLVTIWRRRARGEMPPSTLFGRLRRTRSDDYAKMFGSHTSAA